MSPLGTLLVARRLFESGRAREAEALAQGLVGEEVQPHVFHLRGRIAASRGEFSLAGDYFCQAIGIDPGNPRFQHELGKARQLLGQTDSAISAYREGLRLHSQFAEALNDLGECYYGKGWIDDAITCFRRAVRLEPHNAVAHANLAVAFRKQLNYAEYKKHLFRALQARVAVWPKRFWSWLGSLSRGGLRGDVSARAMSRLAQIDFDAHDWSLAECLCKEALQKDAAKTDALLLLLRVLERRGSLEEAVRTAGAAVEAQRDNAEFQFVFGNILQRAGRAGDAEASYRAALKLRPGFLHALNGLGSLLMANKRYEEATGYLREAVRLDLGYVDAWSNLGLALLRQDDSAGARLAVGQALAIDKDDANALNYLGLINEKDGKWVQAEQCYARLAALRPDDPVVWHRLGMTQRQQSKIDEALQSWSKVLDVAPSFLQVYNDIGLLYTECAMTEQALEFFRRGLELKPDSLEMLINMGRLHELEGEFDQAEHWFFRAQELDPGNYLLLNALGAMCHHRGAQAEAIAYFRRAVAVRPDYAHAQLNLSYELLQQCELSEGWKLYEHRYSAPEFTRVHSQIPLPRWRPESGRDRAVLVYHEQGIGDEILFASCLPDLMPEINRGIVFCSPKLEPIFRRSFPQLAVFGCEISDVPACLDSLPSQPEFKVAIGSLPMFFRQSLADFPRHRGYLKADPEKVERWRARLADLGPGRKVGLSWKGGVHLTGEMRRTLKLEQLLPLLRTEGVRFISLQYTDCKEDLARLEDEHGIRILHWQQAIDDYDETAALVEALDLVISVCTAIVHLSGALGKPVWVMAPFSPGWRYAMVPGGMPWYPSVRVFRQGISGAWDGVLGQILSELRRMQTQATDDGN